MDLVSPSTVYELLFCCGQDPGRNAIECPGYRPCTFQDLRDQITIAVNTLHAQGLGRNARIALTAPAGPFTATALISIMAGFTAVPLNPQGREEEYRLAFMAMKPDLIIVPSGSSSAAVEAAGLLQIPVISMTPSQHTAGLFKLDRPVAGTSPESYASPDDTSVVFMTSGTTAAPKIVPFTQERLCRDVCRMGVYHFGSTDRHLHIMPLFHIAGIKGTLLAPLMSGGTVICPEEFIAPDFLPLLHSHHITEFIAVPAMLQAILRELHRVPAKDLRPNSLRRIRSGSSRLPGRVRDELGELLGVPVIEGYASTEAGTITVNIPPCPDSVGLPVIEELVIADSAGNCLGPGETGEIRVRGSTVFSGYENAPDETAAAFDNGWFRTGDLGYRDSAGYLFLTGRKNERINKGGEKISPAVIDAALLSHPLVVDAMAFSLEDPRLGEEIAAVVVRKQPDLTERALRQFLIDRLNPSLMPAQIFFADSVPRNAHGKLQRSEGTRRYAGQRKTRS